MKSKRIFVAIVVLAFLCSVLPVYAADTVTINAASYIRPIPETLFGTNTQTWDGLQNGGNENFNNLMTASGRRYVRWPGGSWGDAFLWSDMEGVNDANTWIVNYDESNYWINKMGGIMQPIVNFPGWWYGLDHSDADAYAAAVAWVQDQSSRIPTARYWEIGNEIGGSWEAGWFQGISGGYYGDQYSQFYNAMKAVNPRIKLGAVAEPYDRRESWYNYDGLWTREMLTAMDVNWGVIPDFLIVHSYPGSGSGASYNPTLLDAKVKEIGAAATNFTTSMNTIISTFLGPEYVGKIKYWMTEWNAGGRSIEDYPTDYYERWKAYVNAMFQAQYIMEMAKYGWEGSNPWNQNEFHNNEPNYTNFYVYPVWYVSPFLSNRFGRDMVAATTSNSYIRVYAGRDDANNLTIFLVNNYPTQTRTVHININDFTVASTGESWLIEPAGSVIAGGVNIQDYNDVNINGVIHPDPLTFNALSGISISTSNSFDINLAASRMILIKIPPATQTEQLPYGGTAWPIPGTIEAEDYDTGAKFVSYYDSSSGNGGGQYRSDDVDIETCSEGGYDVTGIAVNEWLEYAVNVESSGIYKIYARVASADSNGQFRIEFDGQDISGPVSFSATGGTQAFTTAEVNHVFLQKGQYTMRLLIDTAGWNINWIDFSKLGGGTGKALREWWTGISGSAVSNLTSDVNYPYSPTGRERGRSFEGPTNWTNTSGTGMDNYGTRLRGYLHPVVDGNYTFWIASDDASELWLSTDANPSHKTRIALVSSWVNPYKWDKNAEQKSTVIPLVAGQEYYIEALHKEGGGGDSVAVAWQGPGIIRQAVTGEYLAASPYHNPINFIDFADFSDQWFLTGCVSGNAWCSGADIDHNGSVTPDDLMRFVEDLWLFDSE